jgi:undecaprenyl-phosphate 4-deoxy-4-formamido-L-arabinose transferase
MSNQIVPLSEPAPAPEISVVIPVYNEEDNLQELGERLIRTLSRLGRSFEIIFVDDGSTDRSWQLLTDLNRQYPQNVRALQFHRNFGQHQAIFAGFQTARGQIMVTLDADLQNPPEEIPRLVAKLEEGYDTVGGWRENRQDSVFRKLPSLLVNYLMSRVTGVKLRDYGCMLRAYRREVIDSINQCQESSSFIPALANLFSHRVAEIPVGHAERERGQSKYSLIKLLRLNFDLMTGFSNLPIHLVGFMGVAIALLGLLFGRKWKGCSLCSPSSLSLWASTPWAWPSSANTWAASTGRSAAAPASSSAIPWDRISFNNKHQCLCFL